MKNAPGAGNEIMTIERLPVDDWHLYRLPIPGKIMLPGGVGTQLESVVSDLRHCFRNTAQVRHWTAFCVRDLRRYC